jgi:hypothetical protein
MKTLTKIMNLFKTALDKQLHFAYGDNIAFITMFILLFVSTTLRVWEITILAVIAAFFAGLIKEVWDGGTEGNTFDKKDLLATTIGGVWGAIKLLTIYNILN